MRSPFTIFPPAIYAPVSQSGVSEDALRLRQGWQNVLATIVGSVAMGSQYYRLHGALADLAQESAVLNWDGHGAQAINLEALGFAKRIASMLPISLPVPEVSIDPDGEVSFDWRVNPSRSLSFSVSPSGTVRYASVIGSSESFGSEPWREGLPESVASLLQKMAVHEATR